MVQLLVFDADDTLYHWLTYYVPSFYAMAEEVSRLTNIPLSTLLPEYKAVHTALQNVEYPYATLKLPSLREWYGKEDEEGMKQALAPALDAFKTTRAKTLQLYPHVRETLEQIRDMGIPMVVYSDASPENLVQRLGQLGIDGFFESVYARRRGYYQGEEDSRAYIFDEPKPSPSNLLTICKNQGVLPENTLFVGDSIAKDVYMAHLAGVKSAWCCYGRQNCEELYRKLVDITSWTEEDFQKDRAQKAIVAEQGITPTYTISQFDRLLQVLQEEK